MKPSKAQTSFEFLMMVVIGISILVPIIAYVSLYQVSYRDAYKISMAKDTVDKLGEAAESIFIQGYPARMTQVVSIPAGVSLTSVGSGTIMLRLTTSAGSTDVYSNPRANITGSLPTTPGYHKITVSNQRNYILVSEGG